MVKTMGFHPRIFVMIRIQIPDNPAAGCASCGFRGSNGNAMSVIVGNGAAGTSKFTLCMRCRSALASMLKDSLRYRAESAGKEA